MTDKTTKDTAEPKLAQMPHSGGSYTRKEDGGLDRNPLPKPKPKQKSSANKAKKEA